jgi:mitochondrial chaperone BCS1
MTKMFELLRQILGGQNQFASGGLLLMIIGAIGVYVRALPTQLWYWLVEQSTMMITVKDDDDAFDWIKEWFLEQTFLQRIRRVDLDTTLRGQVTALIPAPGRHRFWYRGRPFWVWFSRSEDSKGWTPKRMESLTFRTIGRKQLVLKQFVDAIVACHLRKVETASYLYVYEDGWCWVKAYSPRLLESVILRPGERERLVEDVEKFRASRERYRRLGVPYHRGYLLYGPPGTGKTSLVSGLGAKFGMSVYAVNLTEFTDRTLKSAINAVPQNAIILFEDIDCMKTSNRRPGQAERGRTSVGSRQEKDDLGDRFGVSLSGLLNVLDGFYAPENVLFVMTTNHRESLDPALLRPGRIDYKLYMGKAADAQKIELYRRFFPEATEIEAEEFVEAHASAETMAEFQGLLLGLERESEDLELMFSAPSHGPRK